MDVEAEEEPQESAGPGNGRKTAKPAGTSLKTQEAACRDYCAERGWPVNDQHIYREVHSGAHLWERPALSALRADMRAGAFDVMVCYAVDRLSREQDHLGLLVSEAEHYGCQIAFVTEDWDASPLGKFLRGATAFAAELERAKILERTSRGRRQRVATGKPLPGKRPLYGYMWNDDHSAYVVNEPEADIVRRIFAEIASGGTLRGVAQVLTRERVSIPWPTARNRYEWDHSTIRDLVANPTYWGQPAAYRWGVEYRTRKHPVTGVVERYRSIVERPAEEQQALPITAIPAIVDPTLATAAKKRIDYNREHVRRHVEREPTLLQGGFGVCGLCGGWLMVRYGKRRAPGYHCGRKWNNHEYQCGWHSMSAALLDDQVWNDPERGVAQLLQHPEIIAHELEKRQHEDTTTADLAAIDRRLTQIGQEQANLARVAAQISDPNASAPLVADLNRLAEERRGLEHDREAIQERQAAFAAQRGRLHDLEAWCAAVASRLPDLTIAEKRDALLALGIHVRMYPADHTPRWEIEPEIEIPEAPDEAPEGESAPIGGNSVKFPTKRVRRFRFVLSGITSASQAAS